MRLLTGGRRTLAMLAICGLALGAAGCDDDEDNGGNGGVGPDGSPNLPTLEALQEKLEDAQGEANGGFGLDMWAAVVDRSGIVRAIAFTGTKEGDQWPGSRVIAAQKANTANAFSLDGLALSTANLYTAVQPGGSLFGLQESNPVNTDAAYGGNADDYGTADDYMLGKRIGGVNVFGGGLALYDNTGVVIGALGVSGDTSCADHNISWRVRDALGLDFVPATGVGVNATDNIVYDIDAEGVSASGWGHPSCPPDPAAVIALNGTIVDEHPVSTVGE
jgi:uncharacterized protein GlcG (DUF336 family)